MGGGRQADRAAAAADLLLWRRFTRDVRRLDAAEVTPPPTVEEAQAPPRPAVTAVRCAAAPAGRAASVIPGLDRRTLARLRRGRIAPDAEIDLHGMTQAVAHRALAPFLIRAQADGRRCALVITGKGYGADGAVGVLKAAVPRWLNEPPLVQRILGFCHAPPALGGEGALMILLRRQRPGG